MQLVAVVNGPNLNILGTREPGIYGETTWEEVKEELLKTAAEWGLELEFFQSNHEGAIIDHLQGLAGRAAGLVINPAALTHYSYALRDALASLDLIKIEVHITNIYRREEWRARSLVSAVVDGVISGLGTDGYRLALQAVAAAIKQKD